MSELNKADIEKTFDLLGHSEITEIRMFDPNQKRPALSAFVHNKTEFIAVCEAFNGKSNLCVGINERTGQGKKKEDVRSINAIVFDLDPERPKGQNSTQTQLDEAITEADAVKAYLEASGVACFRAISGNGAHIWCPVTLSKVNDENRDEIEQKIKNLYGFIAAQVKNPKIKSDNIGDLPRVVKIIGTQSIKGTDEPERPQRVSKWLDEPARVPNLPLIALLEECWKNKPLDESPTIELDLQSDFALKWKTIMNFDSKLYKLLTNDNEATKPYKSESEREQAIVVKLAQFYFKFDEVNQIMNLYKSKKWIDASDSYKEITYRKAVEFAEKIKRPALAEYLALDVQKIQMCKADREGQTVIVIAGKSITLELQELIGCTRFCSMYYLESDGYYLPSLKADVWRVLLTYWSKTRGEIIDYVKTDKPTEITDKVLEELESFTLTTDRKDCTKYSRAFYSGNSVEIPSFAIGKIVEKNKWWITMTQLAFWLKDSLIRGSSVQRVGNRVLRFWVFKKDAFGFDYEKFEKQDKEPSDESQ